MSQTRPEALAERVATLETKNIELEVRVAYQDELIAALDDVLRKFTGRVERLETELAQAREALEAVRESGPANDPPPHY